MHVAPTVVATSPLAISTGIRLIVMTIAIATTLERWLGAPAFRISRITIPDLLIAYYK